MNRSRLFQSISIFLFSLVLLACTSREVGTLEELDAFIADESNGLCPSIETSGIKLQVTYKPTDVWLSQEVGSMVLDSGEIAEIARKYDQQYYFLLSLSRDQREALIKDDGSGSFGEMINTLSFRMGDYVEIITSNQDTVAVSDFMFDRTYGYADATNLLFVFDRERAASAEWLQFNLREFGLKTGDQEFHFNTADLKTTPRLIIKSKKG